MASTYVNDLRLNEMATGDASGSWGTVTNTNLELIGEAFSYGTETIGDADSTLTIADGAADAARSFYLKITSSVDLTTTRIVTLGPNTVSKVWMIENATTGSQVITIKQGSGATINVPNGQVKMISTDGAGSGGAVLDLLVDVDLTGTTTLVNLDVSGTLGVTGVLTATSLDISGDIDVDGTTNLDVVDIDGAVDMSSTLLVTGVLTTTAATVSNGGGQFNGAINVGVDDTGYDVKFFGDTASAYMLWDASADDLILGGAAGLSVNSTALVTGVLTANGGAVFNESGADVDFRIESDTNANALFVQGSDGNVGIGTSSPSTTLHLSSAGTALRLQDTDTNAYAEISTSDQGSLVLEADKGNSVASSVMLFKVDATERAKITGNAGANVVVADGLSLTDGNLIVAAGHGIDFSAQTATSASGASATSELFDHYEEGTWTPTLSNFTVTGATTVNGRYTRIGRQVTVQGSVSAATSIAYGTSCLIGGFPFTGVYYVSEAISKTAGVIVGGQHADLPSSNHSGACFTDSANLRLFVGNFTTTAANENIYFTATYFVA
jgi:hypothetical protein